MLAIALLIFWPFFASAQVAQIVFTTSEQSIEPDATSSEIVIEAQDEFGNATKTPETIRLEFISTSPTGNFLGSTGAPSQKFISIGTTKRTFFYKDPTEGQFTLTVNASSSAGSWSASQIITVEEPVSSLPIVSVSGTISSDTTWPAGFVYSIDSSFSVATGTTLTIEPGAIIKGKTTMRGGPSIYGVISAIGTAEEPIYFTSLQDDSVGGDSGGGGASVGEPGQWQGLYFKPGSVGEFNHTTIRYAGEGGFGFGNFVGIENDGGILHIKNSHIHDNYRFITGFKSGQGIWQKEGGLIVEDSILSNQVFGLNMWGGTVAVSSSVFASNTGYGVNASVSGSLELSNNNFLGNEKTAYVGAEIDFSHAGNTSTDIVNRGFEITGNINSNTIWHSNDLSIIVPSGGSVSVSATSTLTLNPGSVVKFGTSGQIIVEGSLISQGTESSKVYFTSFKDDSVGGDTNGDGGASLPNMTDWGGILFQNGSSGELAQAVIRYSGGFNGTDRAAIFNLGGDVLLDNIIFSSNFQSDIYQNTGSSTILYSLFSTSTSFAILNNGTSTVDARFNWWGANTGPTHSSNATGTGRMVSNNVLFDPWLKRDPALPNPVIIVPGIISSRLNNDGGEKWPNAVLMTLSFDDLYLNDLALDINGNDASSIFASTLIKSIRNKDFFEGLFSSLGINGYVEESDLFGYPYDWRLSTSYTASNLGNNGILSLKEKIDEIKILTGAEEVDLIAHSMGGLLVKKYLNDYGGESVGKFIDIGTPHTGAPKVFKILNYGDNLDVSFIFGLVGLNSQRIKIISQNMSSIYQLLPSSNYFDDSDPLYKYYVYDGMINKHLTFNETKDYLKSAGRNSLLVDRADDFHQEIDNLNPADYGVETYNFVGCGVPTLGQIYVWGDGEYSIRMIDGDGTVPLKSAEAIPATQTFYVKDIKHAVMPSADGVRDLIADILSGETPSVSTYSHIATDAADCGVPDGNIVSFHSPIELHIYDEFDNHAGPNEDGDIENNIDGVVYEVIEDNKFAFLPDGTDYTVKGTATDEGTFDVHIQEIVGGEVATTTIFANIPLTLSTQTNFDIGQDIPEQIYLDNDGDGVFESNHAISLAVEGFYQPVAGEVETESEEESQPVSTSSGSSRAGSSSINTNVEAENTPEPIVIASDESISQQPTPPSQPITQTESQLTADDIATTTMEEIEDELNKPVSKNNNLVATAYQAVSGFVIKIFITIWSWIVNRI